MIKKLLIGFLTATIVISSLSGCKKNTSTNTDETSGIEILDKETTEYEKETTGSTEDSNEEETMASEEGTESNSEEETSEEETMASEETDKEETDTTVQTEAPTTKPTVAPTVAPTVKPTQAPTTKPTVAPTVAPTTKPTVAPTQVPTQAPTQKPTEAPTELFVPVVKETAAMGAGNFPEVVVPLPKNEYGESWNINFEVELITKDIPYGYVLTQKDFKVTLYTQNPETKEWIFIKEMKPEEFGFATYYIDENWNSISTKGVCNNPNGIIYASICADGLEDARTDIAVIYSIGNKEFDNYIKNNKPVHERARAEYATIDTPIYKYGDWYFGFCTKKEAFDGLCIMGYAGAGKEAFTVPTEILGQKVISCFPDVLIYDKEKDDYNFIDLTNWDNIEGYPKVIVPDGIEYIG